MAPFFSIVIPTYNRALLIKTAIESVIAQTFRDWELVLVDDGSTDNTKDVVGSYRDNRIKYIYQKNAERSAARNNGIKNASGKYICFLDSDDYYLSNRLELLFTELENRDFPISAFYTGAGISKNNIILEKQENENFTNIFDHIATSAIHSQQVCIHSSILLQYQYDSKFRIGEDMELWIRVAHKFPFERIKNQPTVIIVDQEDRSVNVKRQNVYAEYSRTLHYIFSSKHTGKSISNTIKNNLISNCYFGSAKYFIYKNERWKAAGNLFLAILYDPFHFQAKYRLRIILKLFAINGVEQAKQLIA